MAHLHYSSELSIALDPAATKLAMESIGAHATRGGWVTVTDLNGREWTFLVTSGIPIWFTADD